MFKDYYEYLTYILNKKRDSLLGIASIVAALFGNLPKPVWIILVLLLAILLWGLLKEAISDTVPKSSDFDKHHICIFYGFTPMLF
jgi:hypothetical protein